MLFHETLATALSQLLNPLMEVVIHDLSKGTISFIAGSLSNRNVGDPSLLGSDEDIQSDLGRNSVFPTYSKLNFDGHLIKSVSIPIYKDGTLTSLMCINADMSVFDDMRRLAESVMLIPSSQQPDSLFKNDWQERLHSAVAMLLRNNHWHFDNLNNSQKKEVVQMLFEQGAFHEKNAADYIAKILKIGRATVFNWLRAFKEKTRTSS